MGCRCGDKELYAKDIEWLVKAESFANRLVEHTGEVRSTLEGLSGKYCSTVNAQEDLVSGFTKLDEGAQANAAVIVAQISGAKRTVEEMLKAAIEEDDAFHAAQRASAGGGINVACRA